MAALSAAASSVAGGISAVSGSIGTSLISAVGSGIEGRGPSDRFEVSIDTPLEDAPGRFELGRSETVRTLRVGLRDAASSVNAEVERNADAPYFITYPSIILVEC